MVYSDFDKLEAFFIELRDTNFHPERMRSKLVINGQWTTINQGECFNLLRKRIPDLQGKDDKELVEYLRDPKKVKDRIIGKLIKSESDKLIKAVEGKPVPTEAVGGETVPQNIATEQAGTTGQTTGASSGSLPFGMPSGPAISPIIHPVPRIQPPAPPMGGREGGTGEGTAATRKINKQANLASASPDKVSAPVDNLSTAEKQPVKGIKGGPATRFNFPAFRSKVGGGVAKFGSSALGKANPFLGRMGNQVIGGLARIANPLGGGGAGSRSIFGRFSRGGGGRRFFGGFGGGSGKKVAGKGGFLRFLLIILASGMLVGWIQVSAPPPPGTSTGGGGTIPPGGGGDISSCKFTRSGDGTKELTYKSPLLLSYIQEASSLTNIPPAVLAAFIRVETPSTVSKNDDEIRALSSISACPRSVTGALGVMQLQPQGTKGHDEGSIENGAKLIGKKYEELTEADYCDVRKNIIMGAGFILKKLSYKTSHYPTSYGDGTKWDPAWTSDKNAIEKLVDGYYGCIKYGSPDDENISCSDPARIYSYGDDVWTSVQNCKTAPVVIPFPPVGGDYKAWVKDNFQIDISQLSDSYPQWAYEVLNTSIAIAPKFQGLIKAKPTTVVPISSGSHTSGDIISIKTGYDSNFFKQIFIHELGHRIKGPAGVVSPACNGQTLEQVANEGYLTYYAENATPPNVSSPACGANDQATKNDEDFAESVSYYINNTMPELNYGSGCSMYDGSVNPYSRSTEPRPAHKAYIQCLLGP